MNRRIILLMTTVVIAAACFAGCTDKKTSDSAPDASAFETAVISETTEDESLPEESESSQASETAAETTYQVPETVESEDDGIPQPGDTYNGHTVDHTEDQPNCDDGSHGTIWIFYTDSDDIDYIEY